MFIYINNLVRFNWCLEKERAFYLDFPIWTLRSEPYGVKCGAIGAGEVVVTGKRTYKAET